MKLSRKVKTLHETTMNSLRTYNDKGFYFQSYDYMLKLSDYLYRKYNRWKAKGLLYFRNCPICNSDNTKLILDKSEIDGCKYNKCLDCEFVFQNPIPAQEDYNEIYVSGFGGLDGLWFRQKEKHGHDEYSLKDPYTPLEWIKKKKKGGTFLDFGCGTGWVLDKAKGSYDIYGVDIDPGKTRIAREHLGDMEGKKIINLMQLDESYFCERFDVVHTYQFIEHVLDPVHYLKKFYQWLKPSGILFLSAPCSDSFVFSFLGKINSMASPLHPSLFNQRSMGYILQSLGFEQIKFVQVCLDLTATEFWQKLFKINFLHRHLFIENKFLLAVLYPFMLMTTAGLLILYRCGVLKGNYFYVFAKKP